MEDGIHTDHIFSEDVSKEKAGTREFAKLVMARFGKRPNVLKAVSYAKAPPPAPARHAGAAENSTMEIRRIDVIVHGLRANLRSLPPP